MAPYLIQHNLTLQFCNYISSAHWFIFPIISTKLAQTGLLFVYCDHAILITTPSGQHILVDGGPSPEKVAYELGEALPFWERTIDLVVLTHAHDDHVSGLVEVLRRYEVEQVLYPEGIDYTSNASLSGSA